MPEQKQLPSPGSSFRKKHDEPEQQIPDCVVDIVDAVEKLAGKESVAGKKLTGDVEYVGFERLLEIRGDPLGLMSGTLLS
jgi:dissimilatory sulfite reductase (desulfoviridin) alpha/beta subunit